MSKCIRLTDFKLELGGLDLGTDIATLWGMDRLMGLRGMRKVSVRTYSADDDEIPDDGDEDPPGVELNTASANRLKRAWLTPRPRCGVCERDGPIV